MVRIGEVTAIELLVNGGFKDGNLSGWNNSHNVTVLSSPFGVTPNEVSYMAVLPPFCIFDSYLNQTFDGTGYSSATKSFNYNIQAIDFVPSCDFGEGSLTASLGSGRYIF